MSTEQDMVRKVQALLAKAESTDNEHEADAFYAKARELILTHAIDEQALREASASRRASERPVMIDFMYGTTGSHDVSKAVLLNQIARANRVRMLNYGARGRTRAIEYPNARWCVLVGFATDVESVKMLYVSLELQCSRFGKTTWDQVHEERPWVGQYGFITGFISGFAGRVYERFKEQEKEISQTSSALIVRRDEEVDAAFREFFPETKSTHQRSSAFGQRHGRAAGDRADIGNVRVDAGSKRLTEGH